MTANIITVLAVVAGIVWLGVVVISALRNRGSEEISPNLQPGINDQELETRRLEKGQKFAIACSAFLAIALPLYFLGESDRQDGFVDEFSTASVERGQHLVEEYACFSCHGPGGAGGSAQFVEKRSGVTVSWAAPSLNDELYRYDHAEVNFWVTYGRGNTPMPAWGLAGGGPMNERQVEDVVNYLETIQVPQQEAVDNAAKALNGQIVRLDTADATMETAIINQRQVVAEIEQAAADVAFITPLADRALEIMDHRTDGIDTDGDGLSDAAETEISTLTGQARDYYQEVDPVTLDPATADAELVDEALTHLREASEKDPILEVYATSIQDILDTPPAAGDVDTDGDGLTDSAETAISGQLAEAAAATVPSSIQVVDLDPANPETVSGQPDLTTAGNAVGGMESVALNTGVTADNAEALRIQEEGGLDFLLAAADQAAWEIDIPGVAESMGVSDDQAQRAVALFNSNCARCHTAGFSAGIPYTREAGSGGFGPALWDGRPLVQFGPKPDNPEETDLLIDFLTKGSVAETPYGINGFGSGRMPAFGAILPQEDLDLLAAYLRNGNMNGKGDAANDVLP